MAAKLHDLENSNVFRLSITRAITVYVTEHKRRDLHFNPI